MANIKSYLVSILIVVSIFTFAIGQTNPPQTLVSLGQITKIQSKNAGILYYKCNVNLNANRKNVVLITVQTDQQSFIGIYSSIDFGNNSFIQYPDYYSNSGSCYYSSMDTCVLNLPQASTDGQSVTIYFSIEASSSTNYTIQVAQQTIFSIAVNHNYKVDFTNYQSGIVQLTAQDMKPYEQVVVTIQYSGYQDTGKFRVYAGIDQMPNTYANRIDSQYVGAFNQILVLEPIGQNSTYFIVIQGEPNTKLDLAIKSFSPSSPDLKINETVFYYSYKQMSFQSSLALSITQNNTLSGDYLPIQIDLASLSGYGTFSIDYCNGLNNFDFENINGQNAEIFITVAQRQQCMQKLQKSGQLLLQNIIVNIQNIIWYFGFSIGIYEGQYPLQIRVQQDRFGTLLSTQTNRTYLIEDYIDDDLILYFKQLNQQKLQFDLIECQPKLLTKRQKCKTILTSKENGVATQQKYYYYNFTTKSTHKYSIIISHNSSLPTDGQYLLKLLSNTDKQIELSISKSQTNIIELNQYQYYVLNLTKIKKNNNMTIPNGSQTTITLIQTNGDCLLLTSLQRQFPNFQMVFEPNSVVDYSWSGSKSYIVNQTTQTIYIGVKGNTESLYTIQATINTGDDLPSRYIKLVEDNVQSFTLTNKKYGDQVLMMYSSHNIPFSIIFYPMPSCIQYSYSLPIPDGQCQNFPNQFTYKTVYLRASNGKIKQQYKFSVYVNSGFYILYQKSPVLIACQSSCYQMVYVIIRQQTNIIHRGMGYMADSNNLQETVNNGKLEYSCSVSEGYPCAKQINTTLPYGGSMEVYYQSLSSDEIQWISKPMQFSSLPKLLFMEIRHYTDLNTAIFYSQGLSLQIYYNIFVIHQNMSNLIDYSYPNQTNYMKLSMGNSLRRLHIVQFDAQMIKQLGCKQNNNMCIATISVYPNLNAEYSFQYLSHGIGYYSSNTFQYYIQMNVPVRMSEQYSLSYFTHPHPASSINSTLNIVVQPLSSCHPQILIWKNDTDSQYHPYYNNYTFNITNSTSVTTVQFAVVADTACEFYVWANDHDLDSVVQNVWTQITSNSLGQVLFIFSNQYFWQNQAFVINFKNNLSSIMVKVYEKNGLGQIIIPSSSNSLVSCINCTSLSFSPNETLWGVTYIVKAVTKANVPRTVIVQGQGKVVTILQNQEQQFTFSKQTQKVTLQYYSNNDFMVYIVTNGGTQRVTARQVYSQSTNYLLDQYITQNTGPWLKVRSINKNLKLYLITIENIVLMSSNNNLQQSSDAIYPKITLHIQQTGTIGLNKLYDGIALFDSFVQQSGINCYQYTTPLIVGYDSIVLDLMFNIGSNAIPKLKYRSSIVSGLINSNFTKLSTGYRLESPFRPNQTYQFCFSLLNSPSLQSIAQQYYLLIQVPTLKHLLVQDCLLQAAPSQYDVYEYIAMKSETLLVELTNCQSKSTLLGSKSFQDILTGRFTELHSYWSNNATTIAQDSIDQGYYYFGLKPSNNESKYMIKIQNLLDGQTLLYDRFKLNDNKITKVYLKNDQGVTNLVVQMPKLQYPSNLNIKAITYSVYLDDLLSQSRPYSSDVLAKCPFLSQKSLKNYTVIYNFNSKEKVSSQGVATPTVNIPIQDLPYIFNLTGSVSAIPTDQSTQQYTYYYDSTTFKLADADSNSIHQISNVMIFFMIGLILGGAGLAYIMFRRWKLNRRRTQIAFQMANYNHTQNTREVQVQGNNQPSTLPSNRKPLNDNIGYSQFADQSPVVSPIKERRQTKAINEDVGFGQFVDQTM